MSLAIERALVLAALASALVVAGCGSDRSSGEPGDELVSFELTGGIVGLDFTGSVSADGVATVETSSGGGERTVQLDEDELAKLQRNLDEVDLGASLDTSPVPDAIEFSITHDGETLNGTEAGELDSATASLVAQLKQIAYPSAGETEGSGDDKPGGY